MSRSDEGESQRPFRIWDAREKTFLRWRCYRYIRNAHLAALVELRWSEQNTTLEVLDINNGDKLHGQYTRLIDSVRFRGGEKDNVIEQPVAKKKRRKKAA